MIKLKDVSCDDVLDFFEKEHPVDSGSPHFAGNKWGRSNIEQANTKSQGAWALYELDESDILKIILPFHSAEETNDTLLEKAGISLEDAIEHLKAVFYVYIKRNPVCWSKMLYHKDKAFTPIFLGLSPVYQGRENLPDVSSGTLFHLDGLHRLLMWGLDDRFEAQKYARSIKLAAYVAGRPR